MQIETQNLQGKTIEKAFIETDKTSGDEMLVIQFTDGSVLTVEARENNCEQFELILSIK